MGLPGERVEINAGVVHINGRKLDEPYLESSSLTRSYNGLTLGEDEFFVLGDNRSRSNDSKDWGPVPLENIVGKVWFIYWPLSKLPFANRWTD